MGLLARTWRIIAPRLTERNLGVLLIVGFLGLSVWVATVPYDAMKMDLADATTNDIWSGLIREGKYAIPLDEWRSRGYPGTQSSVVQLGGEPYVVNEKGPGHAMLVAALDTVGLGALTGTLCAGIAVLATYMLGRRLFNWKVGFLAAIFVLTNLTVLIMWQRYLWTDASTMHLLVLGAWLLAESMHLFRRGDEEGRRGLAVGAFAVGILGGLAFGFSISTRYPVALVLAPFLLFVLAYHAYRASGFRKEPRRLLSWLAGSARGAAPFLLGLLIVLVPLMQYNSTYFGGPFRSGYDEPSLMDYMRTGNVTDRNQSVQWTADWQDGAANVWSNSFILTPIMLARMPLLLLVPFSAVILRRRPEFWLLVPWAVVVFITYLSLPWVKMYANALDTVWEPRYFMPALPALAVLAAVALERTSLRDRSDGRRVLFAVTVAAGIMLAGMIPAEGNFKQIREGAYQTPRGPAGPPGNNGTNPPIDPGHPGALFQLVSLPDLLSQPVKYVGQFVRLENVTVQKVDIPLVDLTDGAGTVTVRLDGFTTPPKAARTGERVVAQGSWAGQDRNGNARADPGEFLLNVKSGTADRLESA